MGFWVFMLLVALLMPCTMIGFGRVFAKGGPKQINSLYGYRTKRSMQNRETWAFAHRYFGRLWRIGGWVTAPLSVLPMLWALGRDVETVAYVGLAVVMVQLIPLLLPMFATERALRRTFDKNGKRRTGPAR